MAGVDGPINKRVKQKAARLRPATAEEVARLQARVEELEEGLREARQQQLRTAELTDVVQALLVPLATRDEAEIQRVLAEYTDQLG